MFEKRNKKKKEATKPAQVANAQLDDDLLASVAGGKTGGVTKFEDICLICKGLGSVRCPGANPNDHLAERQTCKSCGGTGKQKK